MKYQQSSDTNYLTVENKCMVYECSSQMPNRLADNVLTPNEKEIWISAGPPPQHIIFDLTQLANKPPQGVYNIFSIYCWHDYGTNPSLIQIFGSTDRKKFVSYGLFECEKTAGWKHFRTTSDIPVHKINYLKVVVLKNYGQDKTYLNQIKLGYQADQLLESKELLDYSSFLPPQVKGEANAGNSNQRDKALSQYIKSYPKNGAVGTNGSSSSQQQNESNPNNYLKLTSTEKQLQKLSQKVNSLQSENKALSKTVREQTSAIETLEKTLSTLLLSMESLQQQVSQYVGQKRGESNKLSEYRPKKSVSMYNKNLEQFEVTSKNIKQGPLDAKLKKVDRQRIVEDDEEPSGYARSMKANFDGNAVSEGFKSVKNSSKPSLTNPLAAYTDSGRPKNASRDPIELSSQSDLSDYLQNINTRPNIKGEGFKKTGMTSKPVQDDRNKRINTLLVKLTERLAQRDEYMRKMAGKSTRKKRNRVLQQGLLDSDSQDDIEMEYDYSKKGEVGEY